MSWKHKLEFIGNSIFIDGIEVADDVLDADDWKTLCEDSVWPCRSCGQDTPIECEPHEFECKNHYCNGSPACCP